MQIDPALLGGEVRPQLLKQAVVMYQANARQNTSANAESRHGGGFDAEALPPEGYGQRADGGHSHEHVRRGGGVAFAKGKQDYHADAAQEDAPARP
jgi:ribosomal protein L4